MIFKGFTLDPFQEKSIECIDNGHSVVVSAATGTGKTLIADYIIDKYLKAGKKIVYTAPIKALSNQKYRDFKEEYGYSNIGLLTGDVVINPEAPVLIMTTEIYRNMLLSKDKLVEDVSYVIFDEIHFINDIERGTVWEESIIFSPEHIRFLCLSATIPNADEFAEWIESIQKHKVDVVTYEKRAVPLRHHLFDKVLGVTTIDALAEEVDGDSRRKKRRGNKDKKLPIPTATDLVGSIRDKLPCLFFVFSRNDCEKRAVDLARSYSFLDATAKADIAKMSSDIIPADYRSLESVQKLKQVLPKGIAFHHAGMLPFAKELVEKLFAKGMIKVLFATETFAVGINMPAKSVAFASMYKYDGMNFRYLFSKEYFQMAGRAGRRGIDLVGDVYIMINRNEYDDFNKIKKVTSADIEPIKSQFKLSYNTVINLINNYPDERMRDILLRSSFDYFQRRQEKNIRVKASFNHKFKILEALGFIKDNELTEKGLFSRRIYDNEILVTEIFCGDIYKQLSDYEMIVICASIIYEEGRNDFFDCGDTKKEAKGIIHFLRSRLNNEKLFEMVNSEAIIKLSKITKYVIEGEDFADIMELTKLAEGDIIRIYRRTIDLLRQIRNATMDHDLSLKANKCIDMLDRVPIKFEF
ncbi:MAG: DEAD/DEAH box helicase [archaeon]